MSWQAYVDTSLVGSGDVDAAAIFSADGTSVWAASPDFKVKPEEMSVIVKAFNDPTAGQNLYGSGISINGEKFVTIRVEGSSIYGKKVKEGVIIVQTKQAILVAHHPSGVLSNNAASTVEKLGDYLRGVGY